MGDIKRGPDGKVISNTVDSTSELIDETTKTHLMEEATGGRPKLGKVESNTEKTTVNVGSIRKKDKPGTQEDTAVVNSSDGLTVGWLVIWKGECMGKSYVVNPGRSTIGRGAHCDITIDNGDTGISSDGKVSILYDHVNNECLIQDHGGRNPVHLNGKIVTSAHTLVENDIILIGKTELMFVPFCTPDRNWA